MLLNTIIKTAMKSSSLEQKLALGRVSEALKARTSIFHAAMLAVQPIGCRSSEQALCCSFYSSPCRTNSA